MLTNPEGSKYEGHWKNNWYDEQGTRMFPKCQKEIGQPGNEKMNGRHLLKIRSQDSQVR
jgi:hypothetical protein